MSKRVIVIGAGASGLMAAITAAREGAKVTLLEAMDRPGKKLLLTGNGRCNLTNMDPNLPERFYGSAAETAKRLTSVFNANAVRNFFAELGLLTIEKNGHVYPYTGQASSVLEVLLTELQRLKIKCKLSEKVKSLEWDEEWKVYTETWCYKGDAVIMSCGSCAFPSTGSDGSGAVLLEQLGLQCSPFFPALTAVNCKGTYLNALAGVRCRAKAMLYSKEESGAERIVEDIGEVQWVKTGVSGIVIFQISRFIHSARNPFILLDFFPEYEKEELFRLLKHKKDQLPEQRISVLLTGMLQEKLIPVILEKAKMTGKMTCQKLDDGQVWEMIEQLKAFQIQVVDTKSYDTCQVCSGGILGSEIQSETLETNKRKQLYITGELLDVDGPCGGYNLQWAWSSGYTAGKASALEASWKQSESVN